MLLQNTSVPTKTFSELSSYLSDFFHKHLLFSQEKSRLCQVTVQVHSPRRTHILPKHSLDKLKTVLLCSISSSSFLKIIQYLSAHSVIIAASGNIKTSPTVR